MLESMKISDCRGRLWNKKMSANGIVLKLLGLLLLVGAAIKGYQLVVESVANADNYKHPMFAGKWMSQKKRFVT